MTHLPLLLIIDKVFAFTLFDGSTDSRYDLSRMLRSELGENESFERVHQLMVANGGHKGLSV